MDPSSSALPLSSIHACAFVDAWLWALSTDCRSTGPSKIRPCGLIRRQSAVWDIGKKKSCSSSHNPTKHLHDFSLVFPISFLFPLSISLSISLSLSLFLVPGLACPSRCPTSFTLDGLTSSTSPFLTSSSTNFLTDDVFLKRVSHRPLYDICFVFSPQSTCFPGPIKRLPRVDLSIPHLILSLPPGLPGPPFSNDPFS